MTGTLDAAGTLPFDFAGLRLVTDPRLLPPRAWTAAQSRWATELLADLPAGPVLELCAGAGQIGLATLHAGHALDPGGRRLVAVDREPVAVAQIGLNATRLGLADHVETRCGDLGTALGEGERYPLVLADPPWVPSASVGAYPDDPVGAIDGGTDGLDVAHACVRVVDRHLADGGAALLQLGTAEQVEQLPLPPGLVRGEVRTYPSGVLVLLRRPG